MGTSVDVGGKKLPARGPVHLSGGATVSMHDVAREGRGALYVGRLFPGEQGMFLRACEGRTPG